MNDAERLARLEAHLMEAARLAIDLEPFPIKLVLKLALPFVQRFIHEKVVGAIREGLKTGAVVPDGRGGYVPSTNSRYDPKTGLFIQ